MHPQLGIARVMEVRAMPLNNEHLFLISSELGSILPCATRSRDHTPGDVDRGLPGLCDLGSLPTMREARAMLLKIPSIG